MRCLNQCGWVCIVFVHVVLRLTSLFSIGTQSRENDCCRSFIVNKHIRLH
jgi:hypothetical protein